MVALLTAIVGLALGSFMGVLVDRVPAGRSIRGRSACDRCRRVLRWWELVPVVSALLLRHRCPTCSGTIAFRNTAIECGAAVLLVAVLFRHGGMVTATAAIEAFALLSLGTLAVIDAQRGIVPDQISVPAIAIVAIVRLANASHLPLPVALPSALRSLAASIVLGAGFFVVQRLVSRGRWVGDGDTRVGALMGALFAPYGLAIALAASYIVGGSLAAVLLIARRAERGAHIPLVPFLFVGSLVAVLWGEQILTWYGIG